MKLKRFYINIKNENLMSQYIKRLEKSRKINVIITSYAVQGEENISAKRVYCHYDKDNYVEPGADLTDLYNDYEYFLELFSAN